MTGQNIQAKPPLCKGRCRGTRRRDCQKKPLTLGEVAAEQAKRGKRLLMLYGNKVGRVEQRMPSHPLMWELSRRASLLKACHQARCPMTGQNVCKVSHVKKLSCERELLFCRHRSQDSKSLSILLSSSSWH